MSYFRLRCDLQYANSQIQRYKQGRSSSRRPRELPGSQFSLNEDNLSGGFHSDSPRPSSPTSTIDLDSGRFNLTSSVDVEFSFNPCASATAPTWPISWPDKSYLESVEFSFSAWASAAVPTHLTFRWRSFKDRSSFAGVEFSVMLEIVQQC